MKLYSLLSALALTVLLAACGDATGSRDGRVALRFGTVDASASANIVDGGAMLALADELTATGTNGTLKIEDIQLIVSEVELKRSESDPCRDKDDEEDDRCRKKFEGGPFLIDLPLGGGVVTVLEDEVPPGTFVAVDFEMEDFEMEDDDDNGEQRRANQLFTQLKALYPNLPEEANMVVKGVFTPTGGTPKPFIVYFNADVEIKQRFEEPIRVEEGAGITVRIDPMKWFTSRGRVLDLSALNGRLVEFEIEMKNGFVKVERDD